MSVKTGITGDKTRITCDKTGIAGDEILIIILLVVLTGRITSYTRTQPCHCACAQVSCYGHFNDVFQRLCAGVGGGVQVGFLFALHDTLIALGSRRQRSLQDLALSLDVGRSDRRQLALRYELVDD